MPLRGMPRSSVPPRTARLAVPAVVVTRPLRMAKPLAKVHSVPGPANPTSRPLPTRWLRAKSRFHAVAPGTVVGLLCRNAMEWLMTPHPHPVTPLKSVVAAVPASRAKMEAPMVPVIPETPRHWNSDCR